MASYTGGATQVIDSSNAIARVPDLTLLANGTMLVTWTQDPKGTNYSGNSGVAARLLDAAGRPLG